MLEMARIRLGAWPVQIMRSWSWFFKLLAWCSLKGSNDTALRRNAQHDTKTLLAMAELERCDEWGSYRGNLYFGLRTRAPHSLLTGLMWYSTEYQIQPQGTQFDHIFFSIYDKFGTIAILTMASMCGDGEFMMENVSDIKSSKIMRTT